MSDERKKVLIIIPAYNEEESILKTVQSILDYREQRQLDFVLDYIVINDTTTANSIYLLIPSTNNLKCNSLTDLNTLLGTATRFIQASGVVTESSSKLPIVALNWQGSIAASKILTMSSEEATTKFTNVVDVVEPA